MAITPDTIEEKVLNPPAARRTRLTDKSMASAEDFTTPGIEAAWNTAMESHVAEIREGRAKRIPAAEVMKEVREKNMNRVAYHRFGGEAPLHPHSNL